MFDLILSSAMAQEATPAPQQNVFMSMVPLVLVFIVFYFLMIRPQKKRMEEERKYIDQLQKGEEVYTKSGLIGTVYGITDKVVTLEVEGNGKIKVLKSYIGGSTKDIFKQANTTTKPA